MVYYADDDGLEKAVERVSGVEGGGLGRLSGGKGANMTWEDVGPIGKRRE